MTREELEKLLKPNLIDMVLLQQDTIKELRARIAQLEGLQARTRGEATQPRVSRRHRRRFFHLLRIKNFNKVLIIILGIFLTLVVVLAMNGYLWIILYRLVNFIINIF